VIAEFRLGEFLDDDVSGKRSTSKLGRVLGILCMCAAFLKVVWVAPPTEALAWLFGVFGGVLIVPELLKEYIRLKWGNGNGKANGNGNGNGNGVAPAPPAPPAVAS